MKRSESRILTTHTGSLPHDPRLTAIYTERLKGGTADAAYLAALESQAVGSTVRRQIETGIDVVNDGEQQRESFVLYMRHRLTGLGGQGTRKQFSDIDNYPLFRHQAQAAAATRVAVSNQNYLPNAIGPIDYVGGEVSRRERETLAHALAAFEGRYVEAFMSSPSPGLIAAIVGNEHYDTFEAYLAALTAALKKEYEAVVASGLVLQIDCPDLAMERHCLFQGQPLGDFLEFVEAGVDAVNRAIEAIPAERVRLHVCWGNYEGPHDDDVPLEDILPILRRLKVGALVMPFGNARHAHEYQCFRDLPLRDDQLLVAGVVDTLSNVVEHPRGIADKLVRIAQVLGDPSRLLAGTDCGFDTSAGNGRVAPDVVWAKLEALRQGAAIASDRLF